MSKPRLVGPSALIVAVAGLVIGAGAAWLVSQGNPGNMGLCIACFNRDIAGSFGGAGFNMGGVAYLRPEILGLVFGALGSAFIGHEFRPRGGSSVALRFILGFIFMTSSLVFLGCTVRAWLRLGGGDLNALYGIAGIVAGVSLGTWFLIKGFNLGRAKHLSAAWGWTGPAIMAVLLVLLLVTTFVTKPAFLTQTPAKAKSTAEKAVISAEGEVLKPEGASLVDGAVVGADDTVISPAESVEAAKPMPGGLRAPLFISLFAGLALGVVAQRSRFCSIGGIRDAILVRRFDLLFGVLGLLVGAVVMNMVFGQFKLGFEGQPIAHTNALGNFAAMTVAGLSAVMLGGCPFRQVIMSGEGDTDATVAVLGMIVGALFAHRMLVASSAAGLTEIAWPVLAVMFVVLVGIALLKRDRIA
ncbi:MAG: YedE family putative selenium transporter [Coriobacteriia bacterium]|nr:YedE family putative selenium transporter [Coriobacteriia bacterium]